MVNFPYELFILMKLSPGDHFTNVVKKHGILHPNNKSILILIPDLEYLNCQYPNVLARHCRLSVMEIVSSIIRQ